MIGRLEQGGQVINPNLGVLFAVIAVSAASVLIKMSAQLSALTVISYRLGLTLLILLPLALIFNRSEFTRLTKRDYLLAGASGVFLALHFITWTFSIYYTTVASSAVLVATQPVFVMLGSGLILKEWVGIKKGLCAALAMFGTALIGYRDFQVAGPAFFGDMLALAGALFVAGYWLIGRHLRERLSLLPYVVVVYGICEIIVLLAVAGTGTSLSPGSLNGFWILVLLAIIPTIFGHTLLNWSIKYVKTPVIAISLLGEPVGASILALLILREVPTSGQMLGGIIILLGIFLYNRFE
ncbi:MAG TPA: DMT family transporter [Verrucomicrobiae bacterium]|nr:DMT family transporter [Verrucomicrobiae bacterium]